MAKMKLLLLSFSKKKTGQIYTPYSAPITNGILRNSKYTPEEPEIDEHARNRVSWSMIDEDDDDLDLDVKLERTTICPSYLRNERDNGSLRHARKSRYEYKSVSRKNRDALLHPNGVAVAPRTRLSLLLDAKIEAKHQRESGSLADDEGEAVVDECESEDALVSVVENRPSRPRRRLSLLLDDKIEAKSLRGDSRHGSEEEEEEGSSTTEEGIDAPVPPIVSDARDGETPTRSESRGHDGNRNRRHGNRRTTPEEADGGDVDRVPRDGRTRSSPPHRQRRRRRDRTKEKSRPGPRRRLSLLLDDKIDAKYRKERGGSSARDRPS